MPIIVKFNFLQLGQIIIFSSTLCIRTIPGSTAAHSIQTQEHQSATARPLFRRHFPSNSLRHPGRFHSNPTHLRSRALQVRREAHRAGAPGRSTPCDHPQPSPMLRRYRRRLRSVRSRGPIAGDAQASRNPPFRLPVAGPGWSFLILPLRRPPCRRVLPCVIPRESPPHKAHSQRREVRNGKELEKGHRASFGRPTFSRAPPDGRPARSGLFIVTPLPSPVGGSVRVHPAESQTLKERGRRPQRQEAMASPKPPSSQSRDTRPKAKCTAQTQSPASGTGFAAPSRRRAPESFLDFQIDTPGRVFFGSIHSFDTDVVRCFDECMYEPGKTQDSGVFYSSSLY